MTDQQNGKISWAVIRAVMVKLFAAIVAGVRNLEVPRKQVALAAMRADAAEAGHKRWPERTVGFDDGVGLTCHACGLYADPPSATRI